MSSAVKFTQATLSDLLERAGCSPLNRNKSDQLCKELNLALATTSQNSISAPKQVVYGVYRLRKCVVAAIVLLNNPQLTSFLTTIRSGLPQPGDFPEIGKFKSDLSEIYSKTDGHKKVSDLANGLDRRQKLKDLIEHKLPKIYQKYYRSTNKVLLQDRFVCEVLRHAKVLNLQGKPFQIETITRRRQREE